MKEVVDVLKFMYEKDCKDYFDLYLESIKILGEEPKDGWTFEDVADAALRAINQFQN